MNRPSEDDPAAIDRAFAAMMQGYHLTAERPSDGSATESLPSGTAAATTEPPVEAAGALEPEPHWAEEHPLFRFPVGAERAAEEAPVEEPEPYVPEALPPLNPPALPALLGWLGICWAALVVLAAAFGAHIPAWMGWVAVLGFLGGFAVLVTRLPRHRPPDAGDGAVL
jgi:hypothetical protein